MCVCVCAIQNCTVIQHTHQVHTQVTIKKYPTLARLLRHSRLESVQIYRIFYLISQILLRIQQSNALLEQS